MSELNEKKLQDEVILNGDRLTREAFEARKKELEKKKGVTVIETGENTFKTRIKG